MKILFACLVLLAFGLTFIDSPKAIRHLAAHDHDKHSTDSSHSVDGVEVSDQINKTVTLSPGSNVRISGFNGKATVETWDSDKAEINIQVRASSQEAMERKPVVIEHTGNTLVIKTENDREGGKWGRENGWVRHDVSVRLPRSSNLKVSGINGAVNVGQLTGEVGVSGVNGRVKVEQAGTIAELSGINGGVSVSMMRFGEGGLKISGINGGVEIGLPAETNADVDVRGINGGVDSDLPIAVIGEVRRGQLTGKLNGGGAPIKVSGVNGGVKLHRN
ncbi:MAG: hypothetical protein SF097_11070 [Acidobacteriota bacterium]|nr:hypothetical protein [Acidobacteriota bacterium]